MGPSIHEHYRSLLSHGLIRGTGWTVKDNHAECQVYHEFLIEVLNYLMRHGYSALSIYRLGGTGENSVYSVSFDE